MPALKPIFIAAALGHCAGLLPLSWIIIPILILAMVLMGSNAANQIREIRNAA